MKLYTEDELYDLIDQVDCKRDLKEISDYIKEYAKKYTGRFLEGITQSLTIMSQLF